MNKPLAKEKTLEILRSHDIRHGFEVDQSKLDEAAEELTEYFAGIVDTFVDSID